MGKLINLTSPGAGGAALPMVHGLAAVVAAPIPDQPAAEAQAVEAADPLGFSAVRADVLILIYN